MVRRKEKPRENHKTVSKEAVSSGLIQPGNMESIEADLQIASAWQDEIRALRTQTFTSVEQAVEVLVDKVIARIGNGAPDPAERQFLTDLLESDPELMDALGSVIGIRPN